MRLASESISPLCAHSAKRGITVQEDIPLFKGLSSGGEKPNDGLLPESEWVNVVSNNYWSSSTYTDNTDNAWIVNMNNGNVNANNKSNNNYVWPVRAGEWSPIFSFENLYESYLACRRNKRGTINALRFEINAEENLFDLVEKLNSHTYRPSRSVCFVVGKPKQREIIAADFQDRVVHHLLVNELEKIGNLTSQFFANVYLNELDQYVKHTLKCRYYVRYCDDLIILDGSPERLRETRERIGEFVKERLKLKLNERHGQVLPVSNGIDFLGYIVRPDYTLVRRRVVNNLRERLTIFERKLVKRDGDYLYAVH